MKAKVETEHTFVNQLVGVLTLGIYTPMRIRVTCAAAGPAAADQTARMLATSHRKARQEAIRRAVTQAAATRRPVYLQF